MKREVLVLDDFNDAALNLVDILVRNGFTVHLLTTDERASIFLDEPVYIHVSKDLSSLEDVLSDINLDNIEVALLLSPDDELNLTLARMLRERGVPRVIATLRGLKRAERARELGVEVIDISHHIVGKVQRLLSLKFSKMTPISGSICMAEMLITGDSKILGATVEELERKYNIIVIVVREGEIVRGPDVTLQAGDHLIAVGSTASLGGLLRDA